MKHGYCKTLPLLALALALLSCRMPASAAPVAPVLSGTVYLPDGRPAANALLEAWGERIGYSPLMHWGKLFTLRADAHGAYRTNLPAPPETPPDLPVARSGAEWHATLISQQGIGYGELTLRAEAGQQTLQQDIRLERGDRVSGTLLLYPGGRPVPGAKVSAGLINGSTKHFIVSEARTDSRGRFQLPADLPPGGYVVGAAAPGAGLAAKFGSTRGTPARHYTIELHLVSDFRLRGRVLAADGSPLRRKQVELTIHKLGDANGGWDWGWNLTTDREGRFATPLEWDSDERNLAWRMAMERGTVSVRFGSRKSNEVEIRPAKSSEAKVVMKLQ